MTHRHVGLIDKSFRELQALRVRNRERGRAEVLGEQPAQMTTRYTKSFCQLFN
jgi:hypothetical protein